MGREFRIQAGLAPVFPYVAPMVGLCTDESVIGSEFYVMGKVPGTILRADFPFPVSAGRADALCQRALDVLVALHRVDVDADAGAELSHAPSAPRRRPDRAGG